MSLGLYPAELASQEQPPSQQITVVPISGEGSVNGLRQRVHEDPAVRIEDENHKPISGAVVTFNLPVSGTSGEFSDGSKNTSIVTGADGVAAAKNVRTNDVPGRFQFLITASYRGLTARGLINQTNQGTGGQAAKSHGGGSGKIIAILAIVGAAAGGGAYAATRGKSSSSPSGPSVPAVTPIGITVGTGTITHP